MKRINFRQMPRKNTNMRLLEMAKTIHDLRMELSKMIETLKMTQNEIKMEFKSAIIQLSNTKKTESCQEVVVHAFKKEEAGRSLLVKGQPVLQSEFHDSEGYIEKAVSYLPTK